MKHLLEKILLMELLLKLIYKYLKSLKKFEIIKFNVQIAKLITKINVLIILYLKFKDKLIFKI